MPALRFFNLPSKVQQTIISMLTVADIFFLSFTSTRMREYLESLELKQHSEIKIRISKYRNVKITFENLYLKWKWTTDTENCKKVTINVNGIELNGRRFINEDDQVFIMNPINIDVSLMFNYLSDLFWFTYKTFKTEFVLPELLLSLNLPSTTDYFYLNEEEPVPAEIVDQLFEIVKPELEIDIIGNLTGQPKEDSVIWTVTIITLFVSDWVGFDQLKMFKNEFISLYGSVLTTNDVVTYLNLWKEGENSQLKIVSIWLPNDSDRTFDEDEIHRQLGAVLSDANERLTEDLRQSSEAWEIRRNDGEIALIFLINNDNKRGLRVLFMPHHNEFFME